MLLFGVSVLVSVFVSVVLGAVVVVLPLSDALELLVEAALAFVPPAPPPLLEP